MLGAEDVAHHCRGRSGSAEVLRRDTLREYAVTVCSLIMSCQMSCGTNFILNSMLDALQYCDLRAKKLRIQVDGASDNISKAMFCVCALLVKARIFDEVHLCRLPVGSVY